MAKKDIYLESELLKEWLKNEQADIMKRTGERVSYKQVIFKYMFAIPYTDQIPEKIDNLSAPVLKKYLKIKNSLSR